MVLAGKTCFRCDTCTILGSCLRPTRVICAWLPFMLSTQKVPPYFGSNVFLRCFLTMTKSFGHMVWVHLLGFLSLIVAFCRFSATIRYILRRDSKDRIVSSVPKYLMRGPKISVSSIQESLPNMIKKGNSQECSFGRKLYAAVAIGHTLSHSNSWLTCLAQHAFKNAWKPSIHPLLWGEKVVSTPCVLSLIPGQQFQKVDS